MSRTQRLCGGKGAVSVILKLELVCDLKADYLIFGTFDFLKFFDVRNEEDF